MEIRQINFGEIVSSDWLTVGVGLAMVALFLYMLAPRLMQRFKTIQNSEAMQDRIGSITVIIRDGEMLNKVKGRMTRDGALVADKKTWIIENIKPYFLKEGMSTKPCLIVDAKKQVNYRFQNIENEKQRQIAGYAADPNLLRRFTDSTVVSKLSAARPDKSMMFVIFVMGMLAFFMLQSFLG